MGQREKVISQICHSLGGTLRVIEAKRAQQLSFWGEKPQLHDGHNHSVNRRLFLFA
jgi:hypothetical protein